MTPGRPDPATLQRFLEEERRETTALRRKLQKLQNPPADEAVFVWPSVIKQVIAGAVVLTALLTVVSVIFDAPLEEIADHSHTPSPSRAPWYFVGLQELLVYFDPWLAGVVLPTMIIIGLILIPFIDTNLKGIGRFAPRDRPFALGVWSFGMALWFGLIIFGLYFRGTNWDLYGPADCWRGAQEPFDFRACPEEVGSLEEMAATDGSLMVNGHGKSYGKGALFKVPERLEDGSVEFTKYVWQERSWIVLPEIPALPLAWTPFKDAEGNVLGPDHPAHMLLGLAILGAWFGLFLVVPGLLNPIFVHRLGLWRYAVAMLFTASIFGVVGKMVWRLTLGFKYILVTPWLNI